MADQRQARRRMPSYAEDTTRGIPSVTAQMERIDDDPRVAEIMRQQAEEERRRAARASSGDGMRPAGMKKGGMVKKMASGGKVRGDGACSKGKTKGRYI